MTTRPLVAITGASSAIGAATARAFAATGYPLLLMARRVDRMQELGLPGAEIAEVDVTDPAAMEAAVLAAEAKHGPVDLLVNNAGVTPLAQVVDQDPVDIRMLFDVNCTALITTSQAVLSGLAYPGDRFVPRLAETIGHAATERILRQNPAALLTWGQGSGTC